MGRVFFFEEVHETSTGPVTKISCSIRQTVDSREKHGSRAHTARLQRRVKSHSRQTPIFFRSRPGRYAKHFGMSRCIAKQLDLIMPPSHNPIVPHQNGADGNLFFSIGLYGLLQGFQHEPFISILRKNFSYKTKVRHNVRAYYLKKRNLLY